jgi:hypothetical protein
MSGNDHEKKSGPDQMEFRSMSPEHYLKTLADDSQSGQGSGNQSGGTSDQSSNSQSSEKDAGNKS